MKDVIIYSSIGIIRTPFKRKEDAPIQGCYSPESIGDIELISQYTDGLNDIEGFSHLILLYHFHEAAGFELLTKPFLDKNTRGIFATRYFARPNPVGLSVVKLLQVEGNHLKIKGVDMLDKTPLLDIKPYVPQFDVKDNVKDGWYQSASEQAKYLAK